jgi:hypothetical protein
VPRPAAEGILFLSSFAPLFVVFGLLDSFGTGYPSIICYGIAAAATLFLAFALRTWRTMSPSRVTVARARHRDSDTIAYVATYIVPFATLGVETKRSQIALLLFVALVGVLYVRAHLFYVNPILSLLGYRLFEAETPSGRVLLLISRRTYLPVNTEVDARTLSDYIFFEDGPTAAP